MSGIIEGVFEKLSLGQLNAMKAMPVNSARDVLVNMAKSVVTNASEEFTTELANTIFDTIFMGELSTYEMTVEGYLSQGKSEAEARRLANMDLLARLGESAAAGALTGALFGSGASADSYYRSRLAAQGAASLRAGEMPTRGQLQAMNLSESEARGAMVLLDLEMIDEYAVSALEEQDDQDIGFATAASTFANSKDRLYQNSKSIVPINGYEDVVVHGDMYGFVFKNIDGVESVVSVREFASILKESGLYRGGDIRLISCETGKKGAVAAQGLADELGVNVLAPTDVVYVYPDGKMIVSSDGYTNDGEWVIFEPRNRFHGGEK